jgi:hypothetical protein
MLFAKPLIPVLLVLLLVAVATLRRSDKSVYSGVSALARFGYGLAKLCLLLLPLEWMQHLYANAEPLAVSAMAVWLTSLTQTCQIYLAFSAVADVCIAAAHLRGKAVKELCDAPYRAGSFTGLWQRLHFGLVRGGASRWQLLLPVLVLVAGVSALWRGWSLALPLWLAVQMLFITLENWRGKSLFAPLPQPLRVILVMLLVCATNVLLVTPDLSLALERIALMFAGAKPTMYSLLLDKRLASNWQQTLVCLAVLVSVGLPPLAWVLQQPMKLWRVMGILLLPVSLMMTMREARKAPAMIRQITQRPVTELFGEGNSRVYHGYNGWLYPQAELDRLTLKRTKPGATESLVLLAEKLKSAGVPLLVIAMPAKAALYPANILSAEYNTPVHPPGQKARLERLRAAGIEVLDPSQALWDRLIRAGAYFQNDIHWTPETMKEVAGLAAKQIRKNWPVLHQADTPLINATILDRTDPGDLAQTLLPFSESLFGMESAQLVSIRGLESDAKSPVLIIGGDLLRVFEEASASFGNAGSEAQHAGFATQLASLLGRPLDVITVGNHDLPDGLKQIETRAASKKLLICLLPADEL